ncbi:MAG: adenosine deaminase [Spirochaetia bacterium]|nr:adenosine deaminase [Spirochaetia bacterium]
MVVKLEQIVDRIRGIDRDVAELKRLRARVPGNRAFTAPIQVALDQQISTLLNERVAMEELEIDNPAEELMADMSVDVATASRIRTDQVKIVEATASEKGLVDFLRAVPKTEIHLHMEACISKDTVAMMLDRHGAKVDLTELEKMYKFSNLQEFVKLFLFIIDAIKNPDDFDLIFRNLRAYMDANNIKYAEVFLAPSRMIQNGLDFNEIAQTLDRLARDCRASGGPEVRYLIDVSRTFGPENASRNLQRVLAAKQNSIIGIGLGGAELMGPARDYREVFAQARAEGLHAVAHAGEDDGPWSVRDTVQLLQAERIGHGTSVIQDPSLMDLLREKNIPVEVCLTSNIFTGKYVRREKDHPVRRYYDAGLTCTVNTDDPEIFNVTLTDEYFKFYKYLDFTVTEIIDLIRQGVASTFSPDKAALWQSFQPEIAALREKFKV